VKIPINLRADRLHFWWQTLCIASFHEMLDEVVAVLVVDEGENVRLNEIAEQSQIWRTADRQAFFQHTQPMLMHTKLSR
jgi:hypothetical protein